MLILIQLLKQLNDTKTFYALFSDLDYELDELGWRGDATTLVNDMLFNHFGLTLEDELQLKSLTDVILDKNKFKAACNVVDMF